MTDYLTPYQIKVRGNAELARYRRKVSGEHLKETREDKLDRMIAAYHALSAEEKERLLS